MINLNAFFKVSYGLYIVSAGRDQRSGFISNSVFQVTAEPPQFAISSNKDNFTTGLIRDIGFLAFTILEQDTNPELIGRFGYKSGKDFDKFEGLKLKEADNGSSIVLDNALAYFECEVNQMIDVGSHLTFICEVTACDILKEGMPLTYDYYRNVKKGMAPKNAPTYIDKSKLVEPTTSGADKYQCIVCNHIYDPAEGDDSGGIVAGTKFEDLPDDWMCPICGAGKEDFELFT